MAAAVAYSADPSPTRPTDAELVTLPRRRAPRQRAYYRGVTYGYADGTRTLCPACYHKPIHIALNDMAARGMEPTSEALAADSAAHDWSEKYGGWRTVTYFDFADRGEIHCTDCGVSL